MKKTGKEWFEKLSEAEQEQYKKNCVSFEWNMHDKRTFKRFISGAFDWSNTPQGQDYWLNISNRKP